MIPLPPVSAKAKPQAPGGKEKIRRLIVNVCFIIYWLLIFEGALRKWFFPGFQKILFFVRDPFVIYVYYLAIKHRMWPKLSPTFLAGMVLSITFLVLALIQDVAINLNPAVSAIGWRGYFWYLPLAFIIGTHFRGKDLSRLCRQTLTVSIPVALLTYMQMRSGMYSFLNKTMDEDSTPFLVGGDLVRTSGTFTFSIGQVLFIGSIVAMVLSLWLLPKAARQIRSPVLWAATGAVMVNLYTSGSRSAFFESTITIIASIFSGLLITDRKQQLRCLILPGLISLIGAVFYVTVFNNAYTVMAERMAGAGANEGSTFMRALGNVTSVFDTLPKATALGMGLGLGSNAGMYLAAGARHFKMSEIELPRIIEECGMLGVFYVFYRAWLFFWLLSGAIVATRRANNPLPLLLFSFAGVVILVGQMTLQGTVNGYGWLFAGFCMAANRLGERSPKSLPSKARKRKNKRSRRRMQTSLA